jgi:hypothetical protein
MQEICFQELLPWYRSAVDKMVLVAFRLPDELRAKVLKAARENNESEGLFIRKALQQKLETMGIGVGDNLVLPGPRTGVGGYPTHLKNRPPVIEPSVGPVALNDQPSSTPATSIEAHAAMVPAPAQYRRPASRGAKRKAASPIGNAPAPAPQPPPGKDPPPRPAKRVPTSPGNPSTTAADHS